MKSHSFLVIGFMFLTIGMAAQAENASESPFTTQKQAQQLIDNAVKASGGYSNLLALGNQQITFSTRSARVGQGPTPDAGAALGDAARSVVSRADGRVAIERYNGEELGSRYVRGDGPDWIYFVDQNSVALVDPILAVNIIDQAGTSAHALLDIVGRSQYARSAGEVSVQGKRYHLITYADVLGRLQTVYFDADTSLLAKIKMLEAHAQWGDVVTELVFDDYKNANGVMLSHVKSIHQAGTLRSETRVENIQTVVVDESLYAQPDGATENDPFTAPSSAPRELSMEMLAGDIYLIENAAQGYNVMVINHDDGVLVLETPQSPQTARDVVHAIAAKFPGKAIKTAVPTHHHFDHSGGIYGFIEAGIPILTTPGNADFVKNIGTTSRVIGQSKGAIENPRVSVFEGRRKLGTAATEVELINVGPNPHAEEIVIAYIPAIKAVFVADIFSARGDELPPANENQLAFADQLEKLKLDVDLFIPVHGRQATAEEFWASVKEGRDAEGQE